MCKTYKVEIQIGYFIENPETSLNESTKKSLIHHNLFLGIAVCF